MTARLDVSGQRYGRLVAISFSRRNSTGNTLWNCKCDCGNELEVLLPSLRRGNTRSCGCWLKELRIERKTTHGKKRTRAWLSWASMRARCLNQKNPAYKDYGGRGIVICQRWLDSFQNFFDDMGDRPDGLSLERIDVNGNYEPGNCKWATDKEQTRNQRRTRRITFNGETLSSAEWGERLAMPSRLIRYRIDTLGWDVESALTRPVQKKQKRSDLGQF